jgi:ATP-binding cassette subfamily A (ABC1) protein 3
MAIAGGSEILIIDEPTKGIKKEKKRHIWDLIKRYKHDKTVIVCTEDVEEAQTLSTDRICIMSCGKIVTDDCIQAIETKNNIGYKILAQTKIFHDE